MGNQRVTRREFIKLGAVTGGLALGSAASVRPALGNRHPHPRPTSLPYLDRSGTHRSYYDGGRYAYLDTAPDNSFIHMESPVRYYTNCVQIIDIDR